MYIASVKVHSNWKAERKKNDRIHIKNENKTFDEPK